MLSERPSSLARRVPLFLSALIVLGVGLASTLLYVEFRRLLIAMNEERLESSTSLFSGILSGQMGDGEEAYGELSDSILAALAAADLRPDAPEVPAVLDGLELPAGLAALHFLEDDGACSAYGRDGGAWSALTECQPPPRAGEEDGLGPLFPDGDGAATTLTVRVDTGGWGGRMVTTARLNLSPGGSFYGGLIGPDAVLLLGNADGSLWTDLSAVVPDPGDLELGAGPVTFRAPAGERQAGVLVPVAGTPWVILVHRSLPSILAPARAFLRWAVASGLLLVVLGSLGAWSASRRVTDPLKGMTEAAEAMARGDHGVRVDEGRNDELGRLASAFNVMGGKVDDRHRTLEDEVAERTEELQRALARLREAQATLLRQERLATLGQLAGGVGHELRNPLGVMTNALYYLEAVQTDPSPKVKEYLELLGEQVRISEKIVSDLLDFGKVSTPVRSTIDVAALVDASLARAALGQDVVVHREVQAGDATVCVDSSHLEQILVNLFTNASQAMGADGTVSVTAARDDGTLLLRVSDTGPGIPEHQLERIFEPLVTTKARGIGLGLTVSRMLASANGVELSAESPPGRGATFTLRFRPMSGEEQR